MKNSIPEIHMAEVYLEDYLFLLICKKIYISSKETFTKGRKVLKSIFAQYIGMDSCTQQKESLGLLLFVFRFTHPSLKFTH